MASAAPNASSPARVPGVFRITGVVGRRPGAEHAGAAGRAVCTPAAALSVVTGAAAVPRPGDEAAGLLTVWDAGGQRRCGRARLGCTPAAARG